MARIGIILAGGSGTRLYPLTMGVSKQLLPGVLRGLHYQIWQCTNCYAPAHERSIGNDPDLGIDWPLVDNEPPALSEKDAQGQPLAEAEVFP